MTFDCNPLFCSLNLVIFNQLLPKHTDTKLFLVIAKTLPSIIFNKLKEARKCRKRREETGHLVNETPTILAVGLSF